MSERQKKLKLEPGIDVEARSGFTKTVTLLSRQFYQSVLVDNPNTYAVIGDSLRLSLPFLNAVTNGDIASAKRSERSDQNIIKTGVEILPFEQVLAGKECLDRFIDIASADIPFKTTRRLKPYLPVELPDTREGLFVLREIAKEVKKRLGSSSTVPGLSDNLKTLEQALGVLEKDLIDSALKDFNISSMIFQTAHSIARADLAVAVQKDDVEFLDGLRIEVAQKKIAALRNIKSPEIIGGEEREFSQLDKELNRIILEENLTERRSEGRENLNQIIGQRKTEALKAIVRRRGLRRVATLMLSDKELLEMSAKISGLSQEKILEMEDEEGRKKRVRIAGQLVDTPKRKLFKLGFSVFPDFEKIFAEERQKLDQILQLDDPLLFCAQLNSGEFEQIKKILPNIFRREITADNKALFTLAKDVLQKRLAEETTDTELVERLANKLFEPLLDKISQQTVDQAVSFLKIDQQALINNPLLLFTLSEKILFEAQQNIDGCLSELISSAEQKFRQANQMPAEVVTKLNIAFRQVPGSLNKALEQSILLRERKRLGPTASRDDISSTDGPFHFFPEYRTLYPKVILQALTNLYFEYNQSFDQLVAANKEWDTDYQFCLTGPDGFPNNYFVQVDMVGLPDRYLLEAEKLGVRQVQDDLRRRIFEIENSVAMYQLLMKISSRDGLQSNFDLQFRESLDEIRRLFGKPIALLAVTDAKYELMKGSEFGRLVGESLTDSEVTEMSGFDKFFSPAEFTEYLQKNGDLCDYLLYVRSSEPVAKLRNPHLVIGQPLLTNSKLRRIIKANTITLNIDRPDWDIGSPRRINDTKAYLTSMGMAFPIFSLKDLKSPDLGVFLQSQGLNEVKIASGQITLRAKPMQSSYGCYGHLIGKLTDKGFKQKLLTNLRKRGPYVIQPEIANATIVNESDGNVYVFIDRNFFSLVNGNPRFLGGERTLMLADSNEAVRGRIHGNESTITAEVF